MNSDQVKVKIREFFSRYLRNHDFGDDEDIFALGFANSLFAMQLVMFVESEFGISVGDEDLDLENFKSVDAIAQLIERKTSALTGA